MIGRPTIAHGILKPGNSRVYDPDAQAYFNTVSARGGSISDVMKEKIENFIIYIRDNAPGGNSWQHLDRLFILANTSEVAALTTVKFPTSAIAQAVNSPTHHLNGYALNGVNQYFRSGYNMATDAVAVTSYLQIAVGGGFLLPWDPGVNKNPSNYPVLLGAGDSSGNTIYQMAYANPAYCMLNYNGIARLVFGPQNGGIHVHGLRRNGNNNFDFKTGDISERSDGGAGTNGGMTNAEIYFGAVNANGTPQNFWPGTITGVNPTDARLMWIYFGNTNVNTRDMDFGLRTYLL